MRDESVAGGTFGRIERYWRHGFAAQPAYGVGITTRRELTARLGHFGAAGP